MPRRKRRAKSPPRPRRRKVERFLERFERFERKLERLERKLDRRERELARRERELARRERKLENEFRRLKRELKKSARRRPRPKPARPRLRRLPRPLVPPGKGPSVTPGRFYSLMRRFVREVADEIREQDFGFRARGDRPGGGKLGRSVIGRFEGPIELDVVLSRVQSARKVFGKVDKLPEGYLWFLLLRGYGTDEEGEVYGGADVFSVPHSDRVSTAIINLDRVIETEEVTRRYGLSGYWVEEFSAVLLAPRREKRRGKKARGRRRRRH